MYCTYIVARMINSVCVFFLLQKSVQSIVATLRVLMVSGIEELKILQTILLLVSVTEVVQGKDLTKVQYFSHQCGEGGGV